MNEVRNALESLYLEFGNDKVVVALSQYLDKLVVEEQKNVNSRSK